MSSILAAALRRPPVRLSISPTVRAYEVGQPITVRVVAVGARDSTIRTAVAKLVQKIWLRAPNVIAGVWGAVPGSPAPQHIVTGTASRLDLAGGLAADARTEFDAVLPNWADAPSGGRAPGPRIEYWVRAELGLANGRTVRREARVHLVSGRSLYQELEGTVRPHPTFRCDLELVVPVLHARPGETLSGVLRVRPRESVRVQRVFAYPLRIASVPHFLPAPVRYKPLATDLELTEPREFPFEVQVPDQACPTLITPHLSVHWYMHGGVRYGSVEGDMYDREVNVYTKPS
jgi:hypothetical protein